MTVLREIVARFDVDYDRSGARAADKDLKRLKGGAKQAGSSVSTLGVAAGGLSRTLGALGIAAGVGGAVAGFRGMIESASDANEAMNVLQASFGDAVPEIVAFSQETAKAVGRSQFTIQDFVARIGALVTPAFRGMGDEGTRVAAVISKDFAQLSVDLSSFFNTTEEEALLALRSGISGESEPLKRFGVDLTNAGIADALGIDDKKLKKMDRAEKMVARYQAIMEQTANAQGDAEKTADGYANASRAAADALRDVGTQIGMRLLPFFRDAATATRDWATDMQEFVGEAGHLEAAAITLGLALAGVGIVTIGAWGPMFATVALVAGALAAVGLVVDDLVVGMEGGQSAIGDFLDEMLGVEGVLPIWKRVFGDLGAAVHDFIHGDGSGIDEWLEGWQSGLEIMEEWDSVLGRIIHGIGKVIEGWGKLTNIGDAFSGMTFGSNEEAADVGGMTVGRSEFGKQVADFFGFGDAPAESVMNRSAPTSASTTNNNSSRSVEVRGGDINVTMNGNPSSRENRQLMSSLRDFSDMQSRDLAAAVEGAP